MSARALLAGAIGRARPLANDALEAELGSTRGGPWRGSP